MADPNSSPTPTCSVYRYYDRNNVLIYVGRTARGIARNREHNADKAWWGLVERQEVEHCDSLEAASDLERSLILKFGPPFNTVHNRDHRELRESYQQLSNVLAKPAPTPHVTMASLGKILPLVESSYRRSPACAVYRSRPEHASIARALDLRFDIPARRVRREGKSYGNVSSVEVRSFLLYVSVNLNPEFRPTAIKAHLAGINGDNDRVRIMRFEAVDE